MAPNKKGGRSNKKNKGRAAGPTLSAAATAASNRNQQDPTTSFRNIANLRTFHNKSSDSGGANKTRADDMLLPIRRCSSMF